MSVMWKRSHGGTIEAPPDERGGNGYVLPNATAPHLGQKPTWLVRPVLADCVEKIENRGAPKILQM
jgi:hypothetical protein